MAQQAKGPVQIRCNIESGSIAKLFLVFSVDNGNSWYEVEMQKEPPYYSVIIPNIRLGVKVLYLFKAIGLNGEEFVENNNGEYFSQVAGHEGTEEYSDNEKEQSNEKNNIKTENTVETTNVDTKKSLTKNESEFSDEDDEDLEVIEEPIKQIGESQNKIQSPIVPKLENPQVNITPKAPDLKIQGNPISRDEDRFIPFLGTPQNETLKQQSNKEIIPSSKQGQKFPSPFLQAQPTEKKEISLQQDDKVDKKGQDERTEKISNQLNDIARPIIPYNPYNMEDGNINQPSNALQSFSQIIGAKLTNVPEKKQSFIKRPQLENIKRCPKCTANLNNTWKICIVCGTNVK